MVKKGQWMVLPYAAVADIPNLRISPLGVVPQRERRPRTIADYTFSGINGDTVPLTDHLPLQFGRALQRILRRIVKSDPAYGPVHIIKIDLADGFYRIFLAPRHIPLLGVAFPTLPGQAALVAFPLALPMGWTSSPPLFCAATETVTDLTNHALHQGNYQPPHRLEQLADATQPEGATGRQCDTAPAKHAPHRLTSGPLAWADVFVDDHLALAQGSAEQLRQVRRMLFNQIDRVFRPLDATDRQTRQELVSLKKLATGDGHWSTQKTVLGWVLDTQERTLALPPHRADRLQDILAAVPRSRTRVSARHWHQLLGELRSMALALPGSRGLFSTLQENFRHHEAKHRLRLHTATHDFLDDFRWLARDLTRRPTSMLELVPSSPTYIGSCDASGQGMGGIWLPPTASLPGLLWRTPFPTHIRQKLVSAQNPTGSITNSDLELAGAIAHQEVLAHHTPTAERTNALLNDNTAAIHWLRRGSVTTTKAAAYLLRLHALHQRHHRYHTTYDYIPGPSNTMADDCSRLWHLSDTALLSHFNSCYPQTGGWQLCLLPSATTSALISALQQQRLEPELYLPEHSPPTATGPSGLSSAPASSWTPSSPTTPSTPSTSSVSLPSATALEGWRPMANWSSLEQWRTPYAQWARRWPHWGPRTHASIFSAPWTSA